MRVLTIIDPPDCAEDGIPLDWERCRTCEGKGERFVVQTDPPVALAGVQSKYGATKTSCPACDGHGSLKAAALVRLRADQWSAAGGGGWLWHEQRTVPLAEWTPRCEDCGHPMSEGTWEGEQADRQLEDRALHFALTDLSHGIEPVSGGIIHYSPCDDGCRHGGPVLKRNAYGRPGGATYDELPPHARDGYEASWRQVDVRTLGWAADLRPEKLAVLCLRCYAERKSK